MDLKICRICCEFEGTVYIFNDENGPTISVKLMNCANVNVVKGDGLPTYICRPCEEELASCYRFACKCEASDKKLRHKVATAAVPQTDECKPIVEVKVEANNCTEYHHYDNLDAHPELYVNLEDSNLKFEEIKFENSDFLKTTKRPYKKRKRYNNDTRKCSVCGREFANPSTLSIHMRSHTNEKPYPCSRCDKKYKDSGNLKRHVERNHFLDRKRDFICENCGKGFFSKSDIKTHMRTHTGETPYSCSECPARFTQVSALLRHKKRHTGEKNHTCQTCGKSFCTKEELKNHLTVHTDTKKYPCPICNVLFKYRNNLRKHIRLHSEPKSFVCNYCGRTFNLKGNLKTHIDKQHSEKAGYCNICSKNVANIEVHTWRHTGKRPLKCELCSSSFYELKGLAQHITFRHKNVGKYKCGVEGCMLTFPSRPMLEFHTAKLHGTDVPFPCYRCSRGFYRKNDLSRHMIGTHKERLTV